MRNSHDDKPNPYGRHERWTSTKHTAHHSEYRDAESYSEQLVDLVPESMGRVAWRGKATKKDIGGASERVGPYSSCCVLLCCFVARPHRPTECPRYPFRNNVRMTLICNLQLPASTARGTNKPNSPEETAIIDQTIHTAPPSIEAILQVRHPTAVLGHVSGWQIWTRPL